jgi:hypothetical protein
MSEEQKVLTKSIAEEFIKDDSVDLDEFTEIEDDAAEILREYDGSLYLSKLKRLSDRAAEAFATSTADLELSGLEPGCLSPEAIAALAKSKAGISLGAAWQPEYYFIVTREYSPHRRKECDGVVQSSGKECWCIQCGAREDLVALSSEAIDQWQDFEGHDQDEDTRVNILATQIWRRCDNEECLVILGRGYDSRDVLDTFSSEVGKIFRYSVKDE